MAFVSHPLIRDGVIEDRDYQKDLVGNFLITGNCLIVAPTALGKTIIAAQIIAEVIHKTKSKILFLAPTKPLAVQHIETLKKVLKLEDDDFAVLTGAFSPEERKPLWNAKIIAATPQTIENDIINGSSDLENIGLVIFDEAHRATKGYSYVFIAERYKKMNPNGRILALTASPGSTRDKINEICGNLFIQNVDIKTELDEDVKDYVHEKEIFWKKVDLPKEFVTIKSHLEYFIKDKMDQLREMGVVTNYSMKSVNKRQLLAMQSELMRQEEKTSDTFKAIAINAMVIKASYALELLETQNVDAALKYLVKMSRESSKSAREMMKDIRVQKAIVEMASLKDRGIEHPKVQVLIDTVKEEMAAGRKMLVFTHYREMANYLKGKLADEGIKSEKFIGQSKKGSEKGLSQKDQIDLIQRFRESEFPVMLCTSVGEEGLDIPSVDAVIFYEPVSSEIRSIQRKGRTGRHHEGRIIILMARNTRDEAYYWVSVAKERRMKELITEMAGKTDVMIQQPQKQKTMDQFFGGEEVEEGKPVVYVDTRERSSGILRILLNKNVTIKSQQLEVADFLISDRCAIERKEGNDFVQSIIDGRLFTQVKELRDNFARPLIFIEGPIFGIRNINDNAIRGALAAITIDYGIPVIQTKNTEDTVDMIVAFAKREQNEVKREVKLQGSKHAMTIGDTQQFIVESLPEIGPSSAKELLKHFKTVEKVFTANEDALQEVQGIGEKRAKEIRSVITHSYEGEKE